MSVEQRIAALFPDGGSKVLQLVGAPNWAALGALVPTDQRRGSTLGIALRIRDALAHRALFVPAAQMSMVLLEHVEAKRGADHVATLSELGVLGTLLWRSGAKEQGVRRMEEAYRRLLVAEGRRSLAAARVASDLAMHWVEENDLGRASELLTLAYRARKHHAPTSLGLVAAQLAEVCLRRGEYEQAETPAKEAWELHLAQLGLNNPRTRVRGRVYADLLLHLDNKDEACPIYRKLLSSIPDKQGAEYADLSFELGMALESLGEREEAYRLIDRAVRLSRQLQRSTGEPRASMARWLDGFAGLLMQRSRSGEAEGLLLEAVECERALHGDVSVQTGERHLQLARYYFGVGRRAEAVGRLEAGSSVLRAVRGDDDHRVRRIVGEFVDVLQEDIQSATADRDFELARAILRSAMGVCNDVLGESDARSLALGQIAKRLES